MVWEFVRVWARKWRHHEWLYLCEFLYIFSSLSFCLYVWMVLRLIHSIQNSNIPPKKVFVFDWLSLKHNCCFFLFFLFFHPLVNISNIRCMYNCMKIQWGEISILYWGCFFVVIQRIVCMAPAALYIYMCNVYVMCVRCLFFLRKVDNWCIVYMQIVTYRFIRSTFFSSIIWKCAIYNPKATKSKNEEKNWKKEDKRTSIFNHLIQIRAKHTTIKMC